MSFTTADRQRLRELLLRDGFLYRTPEQPLYDLGGGTARWMLDSLGVTLTAGGARLAAQALLSLVAPLDARQLATYGTIAIPIVEAMVLEAGGAYRGLLVRKELKTYGARRRIDGRLDKRAPVIIVDDSVSSGFSIRRAAEHLLEAGCEIEAAVTLVRFDYAAVAEVERDLGFPVLSIFDIDRDLADGIRGERTHLRNPSRWLPRLVWAKKTAPSGLSPGALAREVMAHWLTTGKVLRPPRSLDGAYEARGGATVSLRRRKDVHDRPARMGFWAFPDEAAMSAPRGIVLAAVQTAEELARKAKRPLAVLDDCAVAVTLFGPLKEVPLGELDNDTFGIVVCSTERVGVMGGALPRMPGIRNAWEQFFHAAFNNAKLFEREPHRIFRHTVSKHVEAGETWQPSGIPLSAATTVWEHDARNVRPLVEAARRVVLEELGLLPLDEDAADPTPPPDVTQVFVTIYSSGKLAGCVGASLSPKGLTLRELCRAVVADGRFGAPSPRRADEAAVSVSFLRAPLAIGEAPPEWVSKAVRVGEQALEVVQGRRGGVLLPTVAMLDDHTRVSFCEAVLDKAGLRAPPYSWTRYDSTSWLHDGRSIRRLKLALPAAPRSRAPFPALVRDLSTRLTAFLVRHHGAAKEPVVRYLPFRDVQRTDLVAPWLAHRAWTKARRGLDALARQDLQQFRQVRRRSDDSHWLALGKERTIAEVAFAALAHCHLGSKGPARRLAATLWASVSPSGRIDTTFDGPGPRSHQAYFPGQALLALAACVDRGVTRLDEAKVRSALSYARRMWRAQTPWGAVCWLGQAFAAWGTVLDDAQWHEAAFEIVDWSLDSQGRDGAFLTPDELEPPTALTGVYLEAVAAAQVAARRRRDRLRVARYQRSLETGLRYMETLVYQARDAAVLPNPQFADGGVRTSAFTSEARLDYVQHLLQCLTTIETTRSW